MTKELAKLNFRDVGGLPAAAGSLVRAGVIYRSEGPASFEGVHREELTALGIRLVCDLRADKERQKSPNDWSDTARLLNLDINSDLRASATELLETLANDPSVEALKRANVSNYAVTPAALRPRLRELVQAIVEGETPVLIHCTAGKDRTGVLVALLLLAVGVPGDVVMADYLRSDVYGENLRERGGLREGIQEVFGFLPGDAFIDVLVGVDADFLGAALDAVNREWGSIDGYLAAADIEPDLLNRFRAVLTVPSDESAPIG
ncbi:MAG TPA: tyrosine-protein phosphatase [Frankiaceae bacterium]|jgi:protein-tyrosine phosphatase|nr:tyrosine-protein phosphatase [Frankiaceae bacterium]